MVNEQASTSEPDVANITTLTDPLFLEELRSQMIKFASLQLQDKALAEDAVQEALIGALENAKSFGRRSALKTWVFAILKNKIADALRKNKRLISASQLSYDEDHDKKVDTLFDTKGMWQKEERPTSWSRPMESVKSDHFWRVFDTCLNGLPENQARLFMMREFLELESNEISESMNISISNLHVMLHRARLRLRDCLDNNWFTKDA